MKNVNKNSQLFRSKNWSIFNSVQTPSLWGRAGRPDKQRLSVGGSKNFKLEGDNLSKAIGKEAEPCTPAKIYWKITESQVQKKEIFKKKKNPQRFEGKDKNVEVRRGLDHTWITSRNKQGRSKVLTEKTIQVSVVCFYSCTGRKDITSWFNKSEVACGSFWSHRWKQSMGQSSQNRSWTLNDSPKPLSNHLSEK